MKRNLFTFALLVTVSISCFAAEITFPFQAVPNQPYFATANLMIDAEELSTIVLKIKSSEHITARILWANSYDPQLNQIKSLWFFVRKGTHNYYFKVPSQNPNWIGWTLGLALVPEGTAKIEIIEAKAMPGNFFTSLISGWQEFMSPRGRLVIGSTINTIQSPTLFGQSIYFYIYWLLAVGAIGFAVQILIKELGNKKKINYLMLWQRIGSKTFLLLIVFWSVLELSSIYSQYILQVEQDWKYIGRTFEQKLEIANFGDFYPFMHFCMQAIPDTASFDFRIGGIYNDIKTKYYLYPRKYGPGAEYLIVYDSESTPGYQVYKTFRKGAYIMKRNQV